MVDMKNLLLIISFLLPAILLAQTNLRTDSFGNTTGTIDGERVNLRTDSFGNTRGSIGDQRINTRTDSFGNTRGY